MDSKLDAIFRTNLQPAQQTDTWLGIKRDDPHDDRSGKKKHHTEDEVIAEEDQATLSVLALHEFLKNLLTQAGEKIPASIAAILPPDEIDHTQDAPINPASASAARAYQTTARAMPGQSIDFSERPAAIQQTPSGPPIVLSAEELRTIHQLIMDIEELGRRGISLIPLLPGETFLQSLVNGVEAVLR